MKKLLLSLLMVLWWASPLYAACTDVCVVHQAVATATGNQDFTVSGFGTPQAAMIVIGRGTVDGTAVVDSMITIGWTDGTNQEYYGWLGEDAQSTTDQGTVESAAACAVTLLDTDQSVDGSGTCSLITNGMRVNWTDAPPSGYQATVTLFGGSGVTNAFVGNAESQTTINTCTDVTGPGFEPQVVLAMMDHSTTTNMRPGFGFAVNGGSQYGVGWISTGGRTTSTVVQQTATDSGILVDAVDTSSPFSELRIESYDSSGFSICTRVEAATAAYTVRYLALQLSGISAAAVDYDTHTTATSDSITGVGFKPQWGMNIMTEAPLYDTSYFSANNGEVFGIGMFDDTAQGCSSISGEDAITLGVDNTDSLTDNKPICGHDSNPDSTFMSASFTSFDADGVTYSYGTADTTTYKMPHLFIQEAQAGRRPISPIIFSLLGVGVIGFVWWKPRILVVLLVLGLSAPTFAATLYVDNASTGCSSPSDTDYTVATRTCGAGSETVYDTLQGGMQALNAADILEVRSGTTYDEAMEINANVASGSDDNNHTIIRGYNGETPLIMPSTNAGSAGDVLRAYQSKAYLTFQDLIIDGTNVQFNVVRMQDSVHHILFNRVEVRNQPDYNCIGHNGSGDDLTHHITYRNMNVHDCGTAGSNQYHGIYPRGSDHTIEYSHIYNIAGGWCIHFWGNSSKTNMHRLTVRYNQIHDCGDTTGGGIELNKGQDHLIYRNTIWDVTPGAAAGARSGIDIRFGSGGSTTTNALIYHNTIYSVTGYCVQLTGTSVSTVVRNNIFYSCSDGGLNDGGTTTTASNNLTTDPSFVSETEGSENFSLQAGSTAIDGGIALAGYNSNGSAPDQGAHETIAFTACTVEDGDASTLRITFTNNVNAPLQVTDTTGLTARSGNPTPTNNAVTAVAITGDNRVDLTLTSAVIGGDTVDFSYAQTGDLRDSANIGGADGGNETQEVLAITNQSCTNNVGAAPSPTFTQEAFEFNYVRGTEAAPVKVPAGITSENISVPAMPGAYFRLRIAVSCTNDNCGSIGFYLRYSLNSGSYTVVPDTFGADNVAFCGTGPDPDIPSSGTATTEQMSPTETFVAGALIRTSNAIPTITLSQNQYTEQEYCLALDSDASVGNTYDFRIYQQDGTALDTYTNTPRVTVVGSAGGSGF